jgi:predicted nucleic acid-binding protein
VVPDAIVDTSVLVAGETGRPLGSLPGLLAISVVTLAELEEGVLRAIDPGVRARRLATLSRVRGEVGAIPITEPVASLWASLSAEMRARRARARANDTWIAATALFMGIPVCTQDDDFDDIPRVEVVKV